MPEETHAKECEGNKKTEEIKVRMLFTEEVQNLINCYYRKHFNKHIFKRLKKLIETCL